MALDRALLEQQMAQLPIVQYEFFSTSQLVFSEKVRHICESECAQYGKSWACPPAVGPVDACRAHCLSYPPALLITSLSEVTDIENLETTLATREEHEELTRQVKALFSAQGVETFVLSTESCAICEHCAYPGGPCRFPDRMFPCVESQGILVTDLAEKFHIDFQAGGNLVTWFSLILYR